MCASNTKQRNGVITLKDTVCKHAQRTKEFTPTSSIDLPIFTHRLPWLLSKLPVSSDQLVLRVNAVFHRHNSGSSQDSFVYN